MAVSYVVVGAKAVQVQWQLAQGVGTINQHLHTPACRWLAGYDTPLITRGVA